jgi:hypothetical protein
MTARTPRHAVSSSSESIREAQIAERMDESLTLHLLGLTEEAEIKEALTSRAFRLTRRDVQTYGLAVLEALVSARMTNAAMNLAEREDLFLTTEMIEKALQ